jgi:hypothetical protein
MDFNWSYSVPLVAIIGGITVALFAMYFKYKKDMATPQASSAVATQVVEDTGQINKQVLARLDLLDERLAALERLLRSLQHSVNQPQNPVVAQTPNTAVPAVPVPAVPVPAAPVPAAPVPAATVPASMSTSVSPESAAAPATAPLDAATVPAVPAAPARPRRAPLKGGQPPTR